MLYLLLVLKRKQTSIFQIKSVQRTHLWIWPWETEPFLKQVEKSLLFSQLIFYVDLPPVCFQNTIKIQVTGLCVFRLVLKSFLISFKISVGQKSLQRLFFNTNHYDCNNKLCIPALLTPLQYSLRKEKINSFKNRTLTILKFLCLRKMLRRGHQKAEVPVVGRLLPGRSMLGFEFPGEDKSSPENMFLWTNASCYS